MIREAVSGLVVDHLLPVTHCAGLWVTYITFRYLHARTLYVYPDRDRSVRANVASKWWFIYSIAFRPFSAVCKLNVARPTPGANNRTRRWRTMTKSETKRPTGASRASHLLDFAAGELYLFRDSVNRAERSHTESWKSRGTSSSPLPQSDAATSLSRERGTDGSERITKAVGARGEWRLRGERSYSIPAWWLRTAPDECRRGPSDTREYGEHEWRWTRGECLFFVYRFISTYVDRKACSVTSWKLQALSTPVDHPTCGSPKYTAETDKNHI